MRTAVRAVGKQQRTSERPRLCVDDEFYVPGCKQEMTSVANITCDELHTPIGDGKVKHCMTYLSCMADARKTLPSRPYTHTHPPTQHNHGHQGLKLIGFRLGPFGQDSSTETTDFLSCFVLSSPSGNMATTALARLTSALCGSAASACCGGSRMTLHASAAALAQKRKNITNTHTRTAHTHCGRMHTISLAHTAVFARSFRLTTNLMCSSRCPRGAEPTEAQVAERRASRHPALLID